MQRNRLFALAIVLIHSALSACQNTAVTQNLQSTIDAAVVATQKAQFDNTQVIELTPDSTQSEPVQSPIAQNEECDPPLGVWWSVDFPDTVYITVEQTSDGLVFRDVTGSYHSTYVNGVYQWNVPNQIITAHCDSDNRTLIITAGGQELKYLRESALRSLKTPPAVGQTPVAISTCEAEKWKIFPISKSEVAGSPGLKDVFIQFGVENNSRYWGSLATGQSQALPFVTTEGGFSYIAKSGAYENKTIFQGFSTGKQVPPGLIASGASGFYGLDRYILLFEVAESQQSLTIVFPQVTVQCITSDGIRASTTTLSTVFDSDVRNNIVLAEQWKMLPALNTPIDMPNIGQLEYLGLERTPYPDFGRDNVKLSFRFTNASSGYTTAGNVDAYLLGQDGVQHPFTFGGGFSAGPGLSTDMGWEFFVSTQTEFALVMQTISLSGPPIPFYQVYRIDGSSANSSIDQAELAQQSVYLTVYPNDPIRPYVIVRNSGTTIWRAGSYGFSANSEWSASLGTGKLGQDVRPGETVEFASEETIQAPSQIGTYDYGFMLANDKGQEFGPFFFIQVEVVPKPDNVGSSSLTSVATIPVDPVRYQLNKQFSPAGYLDLLVLHSGSVLAKLFESLMLLRTVGDVLSQPDKIEAVFYEDSRTKACFAQITEYKGITVLRQSELILVPCDTIPKQS